jgi:micrococcal nuclease
MINNDLIKWSLAIFKTVCLFLCISSYAAYADYGSVKAEFVRNYDGDTITVNILDYPPIAGKNISVRIKGIDTPEIKGKSDKERQLAIKARDIVYFLLKNTKKIELRNMQRGKYFRIVADVYFDGKNLSDILIDKKFAVPYN